MTWPRRPWQRLVVALFAVVDVLFWSFAQPISRFSAICWAVVVAGVMVGSVLDEPR